MIRSDHSSKEPPKSIRFLKSHFWMLRSILIICICILAITIPLDLVVINNVYKEIDEQNTKYYCEQTEKLAYYYVGCINGMKENAHAIAFEKRVQKKNVESNPWYRLEAVNNLAWYAYAVPIADEILVRIDGFPYVLTSRATYDPRLFCELFAFGNPAISDMLDSMLTRDYDAGYRVYSTFSQTKVENAKLYYSFPVSLNSYTTNDALVIYSLSDKTVEAFFSGFFDVEEYGLIILSGGEILYDNRAIDIPLDGRIQDFIGDREAQYFRLDENGAAVRVYKCNYDGMTFLTVMPENAVSTNLQAFSGNLTRIIVMVTIALSVLLIIVVYYNYYVPLFRIAEKHSIDLSNSNDVLNRIDSALTDMHNKEIRMDEQYLFFMEAIIENIISGKQLDSDRFDRLDALIEFREFCIIVINDFPITNQQREGFSEAIRQAFGYTALITDILNRNHIILVVFSPEKTITDHICSQIMDLIDPERKHLFGVGKTVDSLNEARISYTDALASLEEKLNRRNVEDMSSKIRLYIDENIQNVDLSLTCAADHFGMSIYTFSKLFKEASGLGFKEYVTLKRFEIAKQLLVTTNLSISRISEKTGFNNYTYFLTWFKALAGESPSHFREHNT